MTEDDLKRGGKLEAKLESFHFREGINKSFAKMVIWSFFWLIDVSLPRIRMHIKRKISITSKLLSFKTAKLVEDVVRNS